MQTRARFGFLLGLLVGTATVGSVSLMMGQSDARRHANPEPAGVTVFEVSHSPDGSVAYLWSIEPESGTLRLLNQQRIADPNGENPPTE